MSTCWNLKILASKQTVMGWNGLMAQQRKGSGKTEVSVSAPISLLSFSAPVCSPTFPSSLLLPQLPPGPGLAPSPSPPLLPSVVRHRVPSCNVCRGASTPPRSSCDAKIGRQKKTLGFQLLMRGASKETDSCPPSQLLLLQHRTTAPRNSQLLPPVSVVDEPPN